MTKLETKINKLARQVHKAEQQIAELRLLMAARVSPKSSYRSTPRKRSGQTQLPEALAAAGLLREPTELELQATARWAKRSKKNRQRIRAAGRAVKLRKPVSEIILESRAR